MRARKLIALAFSSAIVFGVIGAIIAEKMMDVPLRDFIVSFIWAIPVVGLLLYGKLKK